MDQAIKEEWATALESDEYPQGGGALCLALDGGIKKWCCLGVLCDLAVKAGVVGMDLTRMHVRFGGQLAYLPREVVEWAGLDSKDPYVNTTSLAGRVPEVLAPHGLLAPNASLAMCNDAHVPFAEIARLIREQL